MPPRPILWIGATTLGIAVGLFVNALVGPSIVFVVVWEDTSTSTRMVLELLGVAVAQQLLMAFQTRKTVSWLWLPVTLIGASTISVFPVTGLLVRTPIFILEGMIAGVFLGAMQSIVLSQLFKVQAFTWIVATTLGSTFFAIGLMELLQWWPLSIRFNPFLWYEASWPLFIAVPQAIFFSDVNYPR